MKNCNYWLSSIIALTLGLVQYVTASEVHQATGFKIVNVTSTAADIWTRVTVRDAANPANAPLPSIEFTILRVEKWYHCERTGPFLTLA